MLDTNYDNKYYKYITLNLIGRFMASVSRPNLEN